MPDATPLHVGPRQLGLATAGAVAVATAVLVLAVLPAEYGIDPTGFGDAIGLRRLARADTAAPIENVTAPALHTYTGAWTVRRTPLVDLEGYGPEGEPRAVSVDITAPNVTSVLATVTWADDNGTAQQPTKPDYVEVRLAAPGGRLGPAALGRNGPDGRGNVSTAFAWREAPTLQSVDAPDLASAVRTLRTLVPTDGSAIGSWRVDVNVTEAGDTDVGGVGLAGPAGDRGTAWTLRAWADVWSFEPSSVKQLPIRQDRVTFALGAGASLEYKLRMEEGASLHYRWNTTGPAVVFEFHGDRDASGAGFQSHAKGTAAEGEATWIAPFTGRHGWYFRNDGRAPVAIELVTRGVYLVESTT